MRERWLGASGIRVPEIAVEGEAVTVTGPGRVRVGELEVDAVVADELPSPEELRAAHEAGTPVVVRAPDADAVGHALERPEVACVLVSPERRELIELDLRRLKYG